MKDKISITIFTPTYNRGYILGNLYESLKRQTVKDFKWLIVDDGSTDNTRDLVKKWQEENEIEIKYIYQENQGMCGAHNTAYKNIDTELNTCIDSDDHLVDNAVEIILKKWEKCDKENTAGIIALDAYPDGKIVGTKMPENIKTSRLYDLYRKKGVKGDKKLIYRTDLTKKFEYKIFENEKLMGAACKYYKIDQICELNILNEIVCIVDYLQDGLTKNSRKNYLKNPNGNMEFAKIVLELPNGTIKHKLKVAISYIGNACLANKKEKLKKGKRRDIYNNLLSIRNFIWNKNKKRKKENGDK